MTKMSGRGCDPTYSSSSTSPRSLLLNRLLPVLATVDSDKGLDSQVCPHAIGGMNTCHKNEIVCLSPRLHTSVFRGLPHVRRDPTY